MPRRDDRLAPEPPPRNRRGADGATPIKPTRRRSFGRTLGRLVSFLMMIGLGAAGIATIAGYLAYQRIAGDLPTVDGLKTYQPRVMSRVYSTDERLVAELATERRIFLPYEAIPDLVKNAFISAEDQNFWTHRGVDPLAILRAAAFDLMHENRRPIGASTITQQLAKNMLLSNEVSLGRKFKEMILAIRIEAALDKERILELYLNEIYLGEKAYGVAAAAQAYFNKSIDQLTPAEAALLAALPKAPNNYDPFHFPDAAKSRRDWVIDRMVETRALTPDQAREAHAQPVIATSYRRPETVPGAEWFAEDVRRQLVDKYGADMTTQGGLAVHTSLDPALQLNADKALREGLLAYDRARGGWRGPVAHLGAGAALRADWQTALEAVPRPPGMLATWQLGVVLDVTGGEARVGWIDTTRAQPRTDAMLLGDTGWARPVRGDGALGGRPGRMGDVVQAGDVVMVEPSAASPGGKPGRDRLLLRQIPKIQGALVSLDPTTGRVLALSGGWSYEASQFDRATQAQRQPGSSFKPLVYLTAMEQDIPPSQRFQDEPFVQGNWRPNNYEMNFGGPTSLHEALVKSLNLVTVRLADKIGMDNVANTAIAFHEVDNMPHVLPAALGAVDTTVIREAGAYAGLAEGGREVIPTLIDVVQDRDGHAIWRSPALACEHCDDPKTLPVLSDTRKSIADPQSVFQVVQMMTDVVQHGTGYEAGKGMNRPIAGKTGTSQDFNDAWFAGFTPDMVTVVWIGFDQPSSLGEGNTGGVVAAPIWHDFMAQALAGRPALNFRVPDGITLSRYDAGGAVVVDGFKDDQKPGQSNGNTDALSADNGDPNAPTPHEPTGIGTGVDSGVGGLY